MTLFFLLKVLVYTATMDAPAKGWVGFLIEVTYKVGAFNFIVTSEGMST